MDKQYALKLKTTKTLSFIYSFIPDFLFPRQQKFRRNIIFFGKSHKKVRKNEIIKHFELFFN